MDEYQHLHKCLEKKTFNNNQSKYTKVFIMEKRQQISYIYNFENQKNRNENAPSILITII